MFTERHARTAPPLPPQVNPPPTAAPLRAVTTFHPLCWRTGVLRSRAGKEVFITLLGRMKVMHGTRPERVVRASASGVRARAPGVASLPRAGFGPAGQLRTGTCA